MSGEASITGAEWLREPGLQALLATLSSGGEEARVAGGAVRDALLGVPASDVDIATTTHPDETCKRAAAAGFRAVPTGAAHGTITVVALGRPYQVTTLRADVETDGRHAQVTFGRDWQRDAERRDFTINALFADADGTVLDLVGGLADIANRVVRFIGDPEQRIREDFLRILRFFRFFAWYGTGRPDAEGLKACARLKDGLERLSAERVWGELKKLLGAPDPSRAMLWMRQAGVLSKVVPESDKWGIDAVHGLVAAERDLGWASDPLLRLESILPPDPKRMAVLSERLRLSKAEAERLRLWAEATTPAANTSQSAWGEALYRGDRTALIDRVRLALASARSRAVIDDQALIEAGGQARMLAAAEDWQRPRFPLSGSDLSALGLMKGPQVGRVLKELEDDWIRSGFALDSGALLERAARIQQRH